MHTKYTYEIEYDVRGAARSEYDQWLSDRSLDWVTHHAVDAFEVQYNTNGLSPEVKIVFGFSSIERWASFVTSDIHTNAKELLRSVTTGLNGTLWEQGSIELSGSDTDDRLADHNAEYLSRQ